MTKIFQKEIAAQIIELATKITGDNPAVPVTAEPKPDEPKPDKPEKVELLTIKECTEVVQGLSEHTIRKLVKQGKVKSIRAGEGIRGKILIYKNSLLDCLCK